MLARLIRISPHRLALTLTAAVLAATLAPAAGAQEKPDKPSSSTWTLRVYFFTLDTLNVDYCRPPDDTSGTNLDEVSHGSMQVEWRAGSSGTWAMRDHDFRFSDTVHCVGIPVSCPPNSQGINTCTALISGTTYEAKIRINSVAIADITTATTGPWSDIKQLTHQAGVTYQQGGATGCRHC